MSDQDSRRVLTDGSRLIIEAAAQSGADVFVGYPITPANWLYAYATRRFPVTLPATDEITTLQWMAGFAAAGKLPMTATSFPGLALMVESINMAYMMELPMIIVLAQRLGPSTGSATTSAQGDLLLLNGLISGGYPLPVFCPSNFEDCWTLTHDAVAAAANLRTPVVLLTSKEMVMTSRSFDLTRLPQLQPVERPAPPENGFQPYAADDGQPPPFLPVGNDRHQVRFNASTHDASGLIRKATPEALANTRRLLRKIESGMQKYFRYEHDKLEDADVLLLTYGISAEAARDALGELRRRGEKVDLLVLKTLLPAGRELRALLDSYSRILVVEENLTGQLRTLLFGNLGDHRAVGVNRIGKLISPQEIVEAYQRSQAELSNPRPSAD